MFKSNAHVCNVLVVYVLYLVYILLNTLHLGSDYLISVESVTVSKTNV